MKQVIFSLIVAFPILLNAQVGGGQSYDKLPDNNLMVDTSLFFLKTLTNGHLDELKKLPNFKIESDDKIDSLIFYVTNGTISDSSMIENFFLNESSTEIEFTIDCTKYSEDLLYKLTANSDGKDGVIKNYRLTLSKDTISLKQKRAFEKFLFEEK